MFSANSRHRNPWGVLPPMVVLLHEVGEYFWGTDSVVSLSKIHLMEQTLGSLQVSSGNLPDKIRFSRVFHSLPGAVSLSIWRMYVFWVEENISSCSFFKSSQFASKEIGNQKSVRIISPPIVWLMKGDIVDEKLWWGLPHFFEPMSCCHDKSKLWKNASNKCKNNHWLCATKLGNAAKKVRSRPDQFEFYPPYKNKHKKFTAIPHRLPPPRHLLLCFFWFCGSLPHFFRLTLGASARWPNMDH